MIEKDHGLEHIQEAHLPIQTPIVVGYFMTERISRHVENLIKILIRSQGVYMVLV